MSVDSDENAVTDKVVGTTISTTSSSKTVTKRMYNNLKAFVVLFF